MALVPFPLVPVQREYAVLTDTVVVYTRPPVAVVDANVFFSRFIVDLLTQLHATEAVRLRWSVRILDEWVVNAISVDAQRVTKPIRPGAPARSPRGPDAFILYRDRLNQHAPDACLPDPTQAEEDALSGVHFKDRHVAATALMAKRAAEVHDPQRQDAAPPEMAPARRLGSAEPVEVSLPLINPAVILTRNLKDFPVDALVPHGLVAMEPQDFILTVARWAPALVLRGVVRHHAGSVRPPRSVEEYLEIARNASLDETFETLGSRLVDVLEQGSALRQQLLPDTSEISPALLEIVRQQLFLESGRIVETFADPSLPDDV